MSDDIVSKISENEAFNQLENYATILGFKEDVTQNSQKGDNLKEMAIMVKKSQEETKKENTEELSQNPWKTVTKIGSNLQSSTKPNLSDENIHHTENTSQSEENDGRLHWVTGKYYTTFYAQKPAYYDAIKKCFYIPKLQQNSKPRISRQ